VFSLIQKNFDQEKPRICTAFSRDVIVGAIYLEGNTVVDVVQALVGVDGVLFDGHAPQIEAISLEDRVALLEMDSTLTIRVNKWVRILRRGRYRRDLGLIQCIDEHSLLATVLLVPRIPRTRKRVRGSRPKATIFDAQAIREVFGENSVEERDAMFFFKENAFAHGLVRIEYGIYELSNKSVNASEEELALFRETRVQWIVEATETGLIKLRASDRVRIVAGALKGTAGYVTEIKDNHVIIVESADLPAPQHMRTWEVCKRFDLGDFVRAVCGEHRGVEGFIVDIDNDHAVIYRPFGNVKVIDLCTHFADQVCLCL